MARYTDAVCRQCRREGQKLFLKGDRCYTQKCAMENRPILPDSTVRAGARPPSTASRCVRSRRPRGTTASGEPVPQLLRHGRAPSRQTGENLLAICESRLDNVVYRLGFTMSRAEARQLVNHGHFTVNGRKVNIPSFQVKPGMVVSPA